MSRQRANRFCWSRNGLSVCSRLLILQRFPELRYFLVLKWIRYPSLKISIWKRFEFLDLFKNVPLALAYNPNTVHLRHHSTQRNPPSSNGHILHVAQTSQCKEYSYPLCPYPPTRLFAQKTDISALEQRHENMADEKEHRRAGQDHTWST